VQSIEVNILRVLLKNGRKQIGLDAKGTGNRCGYLKFSGAREQRSRPQVWQVEAAGVYGEPFFALGQSRITFTTF